MTLNKVLVDTNICLDVILNRKPFSSTAAEIIERSETGSFNGMIAAHSFDTLFYVLHKKLGRKRAYQGIAYIREVFDVANITEKIIDEALKLRWTDFEDAIHYRAALETNCDAIVTRNETDFKHAELPVLSPVRFLNEIDS